MTTAERAAALATAARGFPFLGPTTAADLLAVVEAELGHAAILDDFQARGRGFAQAIAPATILHVISGNTPAAGLQSLIRGLLLGSLNLCKLPTGGLPEVERFHATLPPELSARVELATTLPDEWLTRANAVIVFGNDATIAHFHARIRPEQIFIAHGHRLSFGVVFDDPAFASAPAAARDAAAFDQLGCLSPQVFYVAGDARGYAARLAAELERCEMQEPRGAVPASTALAIRALREALAFRAANGEPVAVWQSRASTAWTVAFDATPTFPHTPLHRCVFVKPLPADFAAELRSVQPHLSCAGIFPATLPQARKLAALGVSRICPIGEMQTPPWSWHQDGQQSLAPLVRWSDFEPAQD